MLELRSLLADCADRRRDSVCAGCGARPFSVCNGLKTEDLARLDAIAERLTIGAGQALARQGEPADHVFNLTSGSARVFKLLPDGQRQITGFLFAGDFVGLATGEEHALSVEAIEDVAVCRFRRQDYRDLLSARPALEGAMLDRAMHELAAAREQMVLLGRKTALERVASFLLDLSARDPLRPAGEDRVRLPMTRSEIADYLGLTIETVSRSLTKLKTTGVIHLAALDDIRIVRPERLRSLAEGAA